MREARAAAATYARYDVHSIKSGQYSYLPSGKFKQVTKPVAGATAEFELGSDRNRPTLTRIGAGALLAGPAGMIVGGLFKKDRKKNYITVVFADGDTVVIEGPAKHEKKMREFAASINNAA